MISDPCDGAYLPVLAHVLEYVLPATMTHANQVAQASHKSDPKRPQQRIAS